MLCVEAGVNGETLLDVVGRQCDKGWSGVLMIGGVEAAIELVFSGLLVSSTGVAAEDRKSVV